MGKLFPFTLIGIRTYTTAPTSDTQLSITPEAEQTLIQYLKNSNSHEVSFIYSLKKKWGKKGL